ncbi:MAG: GNAT family N-acyltransferase [Rhodospirillaceae bacterium]|nr:GNAT family N-acyltransferase [Rhodospirillaceae bacterium]
MTALQPMTAATADRASTCHTATFRPVVAGNQVVKLAQASDEIAAAQALRYRVFYQEMGATPLPEIAAAARDFDPFDEVCEHLIVVDRDGGTDRVVGTYRFMRREHARIAGGFYSAAEYDIAPLLRHPGAIMELGRSCVDADFRDRNTMQLLWRGIAEYVMAHRIDVMFGCGSLPGTDAGAHAAALSYLHHKHLAPAHLRPTALPERRAAVGLIAPEHLDAKRALAALPPLIKGYLRLGAFIGDGAVVDEQFNTTDVCIVVKTDLITGRYTRHYDLAARPADDTAQRGNAPSPRAP